MIPRLRTPLPSRETVQGPNGWWTRPWTEEGIFRALLAGGWFGPDAEFAPGAAAFATKMLHYLEY